MIKYYIDVLILLLFRTSLIAMKTICFDKHDKHLSHNKHIYHHIYTNL